MVVLAVGSDRASAAETLCVVGTLYAELGPVAEDGNHGLIREIWQGGRRRRRRTRRGLTNGTKAGECE